MKNNIVEFKVNTDNIELFPYDDWCFKNIFAQPSNEDLLIDLLESILRIKIYNIAADPEVETIRESKDSKYGRMDLKAVINDGELIDIEMQVRNENNIVEKSLFYWSNLYYNNLKKTQNFNESKKVIGINILNYDLFKDNGLNTETAMITAQKRKTILTDKLELHFIQLKNQKNNINQRLEDWISFLIQDEEGVERAMARNAAVAKAQREYVYLTGTKAAQRRKELIEKRKIEDYFLGRSAYQEGEEKGIEKGKEEGRKEGKIEGKMEEKETIAKKLLEENLPIEKISNITNLSKEEIEKLNNS